MVDWANDTKNLDYGGGRWDIQTEYLSTHHNVLNYVYDPYNRTKEENERALAQAPFDTVTLSNVLNVIAEDEICVAILEHIKKLLKPNGKLYISTYEGNKSGIPKPNKKRNSYQRNWRLQQYYPLIYRVFPKATIVRRENVCIVIY